MYKRQPTITESLWRKTFTATNDRQSTVFSEEQILLTKRNKAKDVQGG